MVFEYVGYFTALSLFSQSYASSNILIDKYPDCPSGFKTCKDDDQLFFQDTMQCFDYLDEIYLLRIANFTAARTSCEKDSAKLLVIQSMEEEHLINDIAHIMYTANHIQIWLGLRYSHRDNKLYYVETNKKLVKSDFSNFDAVSPLDTNLTCVIFDPFMMAWYLVNCAEENIYICQENSLILPDKPHLDLGSINKEVPDLDENREFVVLCRANLSAVGEMEFILFNSTYTMRFGKYDRRVTYEESRWMPPDNSTCIRTGQGTIRMVGEMWMTGMELGCFTYYEEGVTPCVDDIAFCASFGPIKVVKHQISMSVWQAILIMAVCLFVGMIMFAGCAATCCPKDESPVSEESRDSSVMEFDDYTQVNIVNTTRFSRQSNRISSSVDPIQNMFSNWLYSPKRSLSGILSRKSDYGDTRSPETRSRSGTISVAQHNRQSTSGILNRRSETDVKNLRVSFDIDGVKYDGGSRGGQRNTKVSFYSEKSESV